MKEGSEGELVLRVLLCLSKCVCVCAQFNGLFPRTLAGVVEGARTEKPAHKEEAPLFTNCHKAALSITHHSRETQMALTLSASRANWGITGVSVVPITLVTTCELDHQPPQFFLGPG